MEELDLLRFLGVTLVVMAVPGPSVLFAVSQRLQRGRLTGLVAVLGLETGLLIHVLAACLGVSAVIAASPTLLTILRFAGAAYLAFLGLRQLGIQRRPRSGPLPVTPTSAVVSRCEPKFGRSLWGTYRAGLLIDLLNPKSLVFFLALLPQFIPGGDLTVPAAATMVGCVVALGLLFDGGYAALAGRIQHSPVVRVKRWGPPLAGWCFLALAAVALVG